ncbi:uncharacterized protein LOC111290870 isoform X2 [Durio zibethinus]|nr:uncharacterized protein LOC111290870 isoform X2 [Durio zibethinus]
MRAYKVKTTIEVNRQKGDGGVKNHGVNDFMAWKNPIQGASSTASPSEGERSKEVNKLHNTSQSFLASDAPELVVFLQESDYQSVKDIFIDREVPSRSGLNYKNIHSMFHTDVDCDSEEARKTLRIMSSISNEIEQDFQNYVRKQLTLENLTKVGEEDSDGRDDHLLDKSTGKMIPGMQHVKEFQIGDSISLSPKPSSTESIDENIHLSEVSSNSEAESGSTIHLSDSSLTTMSSLEEFLESPEYLQPHITESLSRTEERVSRSLTLTGPSQSSVNELARGDCGSFAVSPLSGTITYSGPIPFSGSISLRSTSSTASSQSFAFPILPSEWNGSPIRMAEADQRQPRKHQSWRTCFLC